MVWWCNNYCVRLASGRSRRKLRPHRIGSGVECIASIQRIPSRVVSYTAAKEGLRPGGFVWGGV